MRLERNRQWGSKRRFVTKNDRYNEDKIFCTCCARPLTCRLHAGRTGRRQPSARR
ncbi:MAG TPA: hypothetical protein DEF73_08280 [Alistipes sp.]|nr:hypothetical protein [Alistipes sp.]